MTELDVIGQQVATDVVGRRVKGRDRCGSLAIRLLYDELGAAHANLDVGAEERCAEPAAGVAQSDLAVGVAPRRRDHLLGQAVQRDPSSHEV